MFEILLILLFIFVIIPVLTVGFRVWRFQRRVRRFMEDPFGQGQARSAANGRSNGHDRSNRSSGNPFADFFNAFGAFGDENRAAGRRRRRKKIPSDVGEYVKFTEMPPESKQQKAQVKFTQEEQIVDVEWEDIK